MRVLLILAADPDRDVRERLAANASTPPEVLRLLAADQDDLIRLAVTENPNTPVDALMRALGVET